MAAVRQTLTVDEYIELEHATGERHEFRNGLATVSVGGSGDHSLIIANLLVAVRGVAKEGGHQEDASDLRLAIPSEGAFVYPDVVVSAKTPNYTTPKDTLANPMLIPQVLSPSTGACDPGEKFDNDCTIDSFREYLF